MFKVILSTLLIYYTIISGATGGLGWYMCKDITKDVFCEMLYEEHVRNQQEIGEDTGIDTEEVQSVVDTQYDTEVQIDNIESVELDTEVQ